MMLENSSFYSENELRSIRFKSLGKNVKISRKSSIYDADKIIVGSNVRIDDFCILTGCIKIGSFIHISAYSALYGGAGIDIDDYSNISARVLIFSTSDDFSGMFMTGPILPDLLTGTDKKKVVIRKHVIIGAGTIILPGVEIKEGAAVGALSLIKKSLESWHIYAGIPCKVIRERRKGPKILEQQFIEFLNSEP
jgi:acetyltransferase-like isoleucine patch superfamily enzyme